MINKLWKHGHLLTTMGFCITTFIANRSCMYVLHQPELPKSAKQLRKF